MDFAALQMLVWAVEERSVARAAARANLVASAASKRIADLERRVGTTLLVRHNRGVEPTPAGAVLYHRARAILDNVQGLEDLCREFAPDGIPKVRLAANRSAIVQFLPRELHAYQDGNPGARIDLVEAYSADIPRLVSDRDVDLGIYHASAPAPGVVSLPYRTDRVVLVVPASHELARRDAIHLDEARQYDFLGYFPRHSFESFLELAGSTLSGPLNVRIQVANYEARCRMIREGLGLGVMPELIADTYLSLLGLAKVALRDHWALRQFYVCVRDRAGLRPSAAGLLAHLAQAGGRPQPPG